MPLGDRLFKPHLTGNNPSSGLCSKARTILTSPLIIGTLTQSVTTIPVRPASESERPRLIPRTPNLPKIPKLPNLLPLERRRGITNDAPFHFRLRHNFQNWAQAPPSVRYIIQRGLTWKWAPRLSFPPLNARSAPRLDHLVQDFVTKGTIIKVPYQKCFVSRISSVPKSSGGDRLIIDLSELNTYWDCPSFKMFGIRELRKNLPAGAFFTSIDLKSVFLHLAHSYPSKVSEIPRLRLQQRPLPFSGPSIRPSSISPRLHPGLQIPPKSSSISRNSSLSLHRRPATLEPLRQGTPLSDRKSRIHPRRFGLRNQLREIIVNPFANYSTPRRNLEGRSSLYCPSTNPNFQPSGKSVDSPSKLQPSQLSEGPREHKLRCSLNTPRAVSPKVVHPEQTQHTTPDFRGFQEIHPLVDKRIKILYSNCMEKSPSILDPMDRCIQPSLGRSHLRKSDSVKEMDGQRGLSPHFLQGGSRNID